MAVAISSADLQQADLETDVLIVGGGPLGLTASIGLTRRGVDHIVAESGGVKPGDAQDLCEGELIGGRYPDLAATRVRALGGTSHIWGGHSAPLRKIDFEPRPYLGLKGWPISYDEYRVWVTEVAPLFHMEDDFDAHSIKGATGKYTDRDYLNFDLEAFKLSPVSGTATKMKTGDFWTYNKERTEGRIVTNLTARWLEFSESGRVESITFSRPDGTTIKIAARQFILALGGIETARFLLINRHRNPTTPLRALHKIGRGFMEHPHPYLADAYLFDALPDQFYGGRQEDGSVARYAFYFKERTQRMFELPGMYFRFAKLRGSTPSNPSRIVRVRLLGLSEQVPSDSRYVAISHTKTDRLGDPLTQLAYYADHLDHRTSQIAVSLIAAELAAAGWGRVATRINVLEGDEPIDKLPWIGTGHHHMGTVRMGWSKMDGVVDRNLKVFGTPNLNVASTGVFPTSSAVNPTMNGAAFAMRLADHIAGSI